MPPKFDVLYMRGEAFGVITPPDVGRVAEDVKTAIALPLEAFSGIVADLRAFSGFMDRKAIRDVVQKYVSDEKAVTVLVRLIGGTGEIIYQRGINPADFVKSILDWQNDPKNVSQKKLSDDEASSLADRLLPLLEEFRGSVRQRKAERLATSLGQRCEALDLICELRPVYDSDHTEVLGLIPLTVLKVVSTGVSGLPEASEIVLSGSQVKELMLKATGAVKKLGVLRTFAAEIGKPVPSVPVAEMGE